MCAFFWVAKDLYGIEQEVRENMWKLQGSRAKPPIAPASKAVNVSADDFNDET